MKKIFAAAALTVLCSTAALASDFSAEAYTDAVTKYLWRGQVLSESFSLQPGFDISIGSLSFGFWGSHSLETGEFEEADYTISYSETVPGADFLEVSSGFTVYTFPYTPVSAGNNSTEIFIGIAGDVPASPYATFYYDTVGGSGGYMDAGISNDLDLEIVAVSLGAGIGYNFEQWGYERSFTVLTPSASVSYELESFSASAGITGQLALDEQYENDFFISLGISYGI